MNVQLSTMANGDIKVAFREDGAIAFSGYGLMQFGEHLVKLMGKNSLEAFQSDLNPLRENLQVISRSGGQPYRGAPHWASNFCAQYEGAETENSGISWVPVEVQSVLFEKFDVNRGIDKYGERIPGAQYCGE